MTPCQAAAVATPEQASHHLGPRDARCLRLGVGGTVLDPASGGGGWDLVLIALVEGPDSVHLVRDETSGRQDDGVS